MIIFVLFYLSKSRFLSLAESSVNHMPCKHEDLNLDPQKTHGKLGEVIPTFNLSNGEVTESSWAVSLGDTVKFQVN